MVQHHQYFFYCFLNLRFLVMEKGLKVHTEMMVWPFSSKISYACIGFHLSHIFYRPFQYLFGQCPALHPTIDMYFFPPLTMPWVLPRVKYVASLIHYFIWRHYHNWKAWLPGLLQNFLHFFIKNHLPLQIYVHIYLLLDILHLYVILGSIMSILNSSNSFCCFKRICYIFL